MLADGARYRVADFQGQPSLLAALQQAGVAVDSDCRNGSCGACAVALRAGQVRTLLDCEFRAPPGQVLACACVPASDLLLGR